MLYLISSNSLPECVCVVYFDTNENKKPKPKLKSANLNLRTYYPKHKPTNLNPNL